MCKHDECFSTVVCLPKFGDGPNIHGIEDEELRDGPSFSEPFWRLYRFCENIAACAVFADDSSEDEASPLMFKETPPEIAIIAHNGNKFDFPFLCNEVYRNNMDLEFLLKWKFVDTLEVFRSLDGESHGGCVKLQCLLRYLTGGEKLGAHRALDDCFALKSVLESMAG